MKEQYSRKMNGYLAGILVGASCIFGGLEAKAQWTAAGNANAAVMNDRNLTPDQKASLVAANYAAAFQTANAQAESEKREKEILENQKKQENQNTLNRRSKPRPGDYQSPQNSQALEIKTLPEFFICAYWKDLNGNNCGDYEEVAGLNKTTIKLGNQFRIAAQNTDSDDQAYRLLVYGPDGKSVYDSGQFILSPKQITGISDAYWEIVGKQISKAGTGNYIAAWYVNGKLKEASKFELTKD